MINCALGPAETPHPYEHGARGIKLQFVRPGGKPAHVCIRACVRARGHLFPRNPLHPTMTMSLASGERGESFLCLTLQEASPLLISSGLLFRCARLGEGSYLAVRVYPEYKTAEERASGVGRESRRVSRSGLRSADKRERKREYKEEKRGSRRKGRSSRCTLRNHRRGCRGRYTGESDSKVDRKIVSTAKRP
jgi:hypothetical protein